MYLVLRRYRELCMLFDVLRETYRTRRRKQIGPRECLASPLTTVRWRREPGLPLPRDYWQ